MSCEQCESYAQSIRSACESVGKDKDGTFPFNAHDLAERIKRLEKEVADMHDGLLACFPKT